MLALWLISFGFVAGLVEAAPITGDSYKIITQQPGIYRVDYADLTAAGFDPTGIDTSTFQLFNRGEEVAFWLEDGGDNRFDPGDYFLFYAESHTTRYTDENVYWFVAGEAQRISPNAVSAAPGTAPLDLSFWRTEHYEQDLTYKSALPLKGDDADRWYWRYFQACAPNSRICRDAYGYKNDRTFDFDAPGLSSQPFTATLTLALRGSVNEFPNPDHHIKTSVNGTLVSDDYFDGAILWTPSIPVSSTVLTENGNVLRLQIPDDLTNASSQGYVNWFELTYLSDFIAQGDELHFSGDEAGVWRFRVEGFSNAAIWVLDVTQPKRPRWLLDATVSGAGPFSVEFEADNGAGGAKYYAAAAPAWRAPLQILADAPSNLRAVSNQADYLVLTHAKFKAQAQQLADHRAATNGFRTMVVDLQDVYDEFNNGLMSPVAIRDFIFYATHYWDSPKPRYVVLFGDGNYDFLDNYGIGETIYAPPWLAAVDPFQGETAADNRFVDVFGDEQYDSDGDNAHTARDIKISDGKMVLSVDFGYIGGAQQASLNAPDTASLVTAIGDRVFWDEDKDGIFDFNERGAPGVTVNLWRDGAIVQTVVTDAEGYYFFEDIPSGDYQVEVVLPAGWSFSPKDVGADERYDSDFDPATGFTDIISYTYAQQAQLDWDAGIHRSGTIGNRVWNDLDGDGLQDENEPGIAGVQLDLWQNGVVVASATTDANGYYYFYDLPDGVYDVQVASSNFGVGGALAGRTLSPWDQGFDAMPDLYFGRFPVNTVTQAAEMVNRTIQYETSAASGDWQKRVVFVADNPDGAGNFYEHSDAVADNIWPYPAESREIYYLRDYGNSADMKTAIINSIDEGALFVTYNGHASKRTWGDSFFDRDDVSSLNNTIFPVFLPMTCLVGQYINPGFTSLSEAMVRTSGRGAVASFTPTGLGVATGHQYLYTTFFQAVVDGETELGALTTLAKQSLFESHSVFRDLLDTYVLFGDPALKVKAPAANTAITLTVTPESNVLPGDPVTFTISYSNTGILEAANAVITNALPSVLVNPTIVANPPVTQTATSPYRWEVGNLSFGQGGVITITATLDPSLSHAVPIVSVARIVAAGETPDADNEAAASVNQPVTLGGLAFYDANSNSLLDGDEASNAIYGVVLTISGEDGSIYNAMSDVNGRWLVENVMAGTYTVTATSPPLLAPTTPSTRVVTLAAGQQNLDIHFGYIAPTAVQLRDFRAILSADGVEVLWETMLEEDLAGFYVRRGSDASNPGQRISSFIPAAGDGLAASYRFLDEDATNASSYYWLEAIDVSGESQLFGPIAVDDPGGPIAAHKLFLGFLLRR